MWKMRSCSRASVVVAGIVLAGCQTDPTAGSNDPQSSSPRDPSQEISSLEAELLAAQGDLAESVEQAKACFEDFKSCKEAAAAGSADCGDALKACLPGPTSIPVDCAPSAGGGAPAAPGSGLGSLGGGNFPGGGLFGRLKGGPDAGVPGPGLIGGGLPDLGAVCAGLPRAAGPLVACKDSVSAGMAQQLDPTAIGASFQACVGDAFKDMLSDICERITAECGASALPVEVCDRLEERCSDPALLP
jgi:hypothetical protein